MSTAQPKRLDDDFRFGKEEKEERQKNPPQKLPGRQPGQSPPEGGIDPKPATKITPPDPPTEPGRKGDPT